MTKKKRRGKARKPEPYFKKEGLEVFSLYLEPQVMKTIRRFALEDDRSIQKTIRRVLGDYIRLRLLREISKKAETDL